MTKFVLLLVTENHLSALRSSNLVLRFIRLKSSIALNINMTSRGFGVLGFRVRVRVRVRFRARVRIRVRVRVDASGG